MPYCCFRLKSGEPLHAWCAKNNCSYEAIVARIEKGATTVEDAIAGYLPRRGFKHNAKFFYKGQLLRRYYSDINDYRNALRFIRKGMSVEQAVEAVKGLAKRTKYFYNGQPLCKYFGYGSPRYVWACKHIRKGMSVEIAVYRAEIFF